MATTTLGKVSVTPKGAWNGGLSYAILDIVTYLGGSYIAKQAVPANTQITDTNYWIQITEKGNTGDAAGFDTPTASASTLPVGSSATASVTASGPATSKQFAFEFGLPTGATGATGNGISSVAKTSTAGLVDTYTITFTDGTTTTFDVTNGTSELEGTTGQSTVKGMTQKAITDNLTALNNDKAQKTELAKTDRSLKYLWELTKGQSWSTTAGTTPVYADAVPQGSHMADVSMIGGKSAVWNNLITNGNFDTTNNWISSHPISASGNVLSVNITENEFNPFYQFDIKTISGHKYYCHHYVKSDKNLSDYRFGLSNYLGLFIGTTDSTWKEIESVGTCNETTSNAILYIYPSNTTFPSGTYPVNIYLKNVFIIDLTQMFGAGNEPTTTSDSRIAFIKEYALLHPAYNAGTIIDAKTDKVESVGVNIWDEEWENGFIDVNTGINTPSGEYYRSKNYIPVLPNTSYYYKYPTSVRYGRIYFYDSNKNFINYVESATYVNNERTTGNDVYFIRFVIAHSEYGTTYNHDIQICLNTYSAKTTYHPYVKDTTNIPSSILALDGYGWSAGTVYNYVDFVNKKYHKRIGSVNLGSLNYLRNATGAGNYYFRANIFPLPKRAHDSTTKANCICSMYENDTGDHVYTLGTNMHYCIPCDNDIVMIINDSYSDAASFKTAMNGVMLYYELATPQIYDVTDLFTDDVIISTEAGGTLTFHQQNDVKLAIPNTTTHYINLSEVTA